MLRIVVRVAVGATVIGLALTGCGGRAAVQRVTVTQSAQPAVTGLTAAFVTAKVRDDNATQNAGLSAIHCLRGSTATTFGCYATASNGYFVMFKALCTQAGACVETNWGSGP